MQGLDQSAQKITEFTSSVMSMFIFMVMVGAVFAIFSTIRAYNRGEADESQRQRAIFVGVIIILLSIVVKIVLVGIDDSSSSSSSSNGFFSKWSLDFNYEEFKKYLSAYWGYGKVVIIFITLYYVARLIYLYRLRKNASKMFSRYNAIIEKYNAEKKPIQDHKVEIFKVESELINPLDPELWSKNVAYYFVEREINNDF